MGDKEKKKVRNGALAGALLAVISASLLNVAAGTEAGVEIGLNIEKFAPFLIFTDSSVPQDHLIDLAKEAVFFLPIIGAIFGELDYQNSRA